MTFRRAYFQLSMINELLNKQSQNNVDKLVDKLTKLPNLKSCTKIWPLNTEQLICSLSDTRKSVCLLKWK